MKTVLITGGNSGIGKATAEQLILQGYHVIIAARDHTKSQQVVDDIRKHNCHANIDAMPLDLSDLEQVREFADAFRVRVKVLDVLILNAGLFPTHKQLTVQGFEMQFGVNHLGHFLLTQLLLDLVEAAPEGRIIVLSSIMHWIGRIDFASFNGEKSYNAMRSYSQSKLANVLFTQELTRRLQGTRITVNAVHPGAVDTGIVRDLPNVIQKLNSLLAMSPRKAAATSVYLATSAEVNGISGKFFINCKTRPSSPLASKKTAEKLWEISDDICRKYIA